MNVAFSQALLMIGEANIVPCQVIWLKINFLDVFIYDAASFTMCVAPKLGAYYNGPRFKCQLESGIKYGLKTLNTHGQSL